MVLALLIIAFIIFLVGGELVEIRHNISNVSVGLDRIASNLNKINTTLSQHNNSKNT